MLTNRYLYQLYINITPTLKLIPYYYSYHKIVLTIYTLYLYNGLQTLFTNLYLLLLIL